MAQPKRESDSDDVPTTETYRTAFIDTNLDTHLAMIVSDADTVLDLKKKIMKEHPQCFPNLGKINIHALMVKRKGHFYHLSDSMPVRSAFSGAKKFCYLSVDASILKQHGDNQFSSKPDGGNQVALLCISKTCSGDRNNKLPDGPSTSVDLLDTSSFPQPGTRQYADQKVPGVGQSGPRDSSKEFLKDLEMEVKHVTEDPSKNSSCDSKRRLDFEMEKLDLLSDRNDIPETNGEHKHGEFQVEVNNVKYNNSPEGSLITRPASKKKRKSKKKIADAVSNCFVKDSNASIVASDMSASQPGIIGREISSGNTDKQDLNDMEAENMNFGKGPCQVSLPATNFRSDFAEIHETRVECVNLKSRNMMGDAHGNDSFMEASESMHRARKKRKRESKGDANPSEINNTLLSNFSTESPKPIAIIPDNSEKFEPPHQGEAGVLSKEAVVSANLSENNVVMESGKSAGSKRIKKKAKISVPPEQVMSNVEHADNSATGISSTEKNSTFDDHYSSEAKKDEIIMSQTERTKISKSILNNWENDDVGGNKAESLPSTQVNKTQENRENIDGNLRKKARKKRSSDPKTSADFSVKEKTHEVEPPQLNQINMTQENSEVMQEMPRKKTKRSQNSAAQSLQDLPSNEKEIGEVRTSDERCKEVDTTSETKQKTKSVKSSSKTQSTGQELEPEKNRGTELGSFHPSKTTKTVDSAIVRSSDTLEEHKPEVVPAELVIDKVNEAKRSVKDVKAKKDAKKKFAPTTTSSDLQNSPEFSKVSDVNQGSERKSHGRNSSSIQRQESLLKEKHEARLQSKSEVYENGANVPDSHDLKQIKTMLKEVKQSDIVNSSNVCGSVPAYPKESSKSAGATSSSSESSDKYLQNKKESKHQLILDRRHVTVSKASSEKKAKVVNNSRREVSLLATPGAIFWDGSSESSEDGNGVVNSDASTKTPSDNSSSSGYSEGEVKSPVNGNYGEKGNDGGKSIIKSQGASGLRNLPIDMILRSSSRFKKAKRTADQSQLEDTESQPVHFVPDSQPNA